LLLWGAAFKKVSHNEIIFNQQDKGSFYYQVHQGSVRCVNVNDDGPEFIQGIVAPGDSFGELILFDELPYACTAIANENTVLIRLHKFIFCKLLNENADLLLAFTRSFVDTLRFKTMLLNEVSCFGPEHRIATLLSYFKQTQKSTCCHYNQIKLTRQQIANMIGLRVETVIRTMQKLKEKGILSIVKGKVFY
jgi:CRP/FNR family transcriptional regulator, cyclic AMP receptor protein